MRVDTRVKKSEYRVYIAGDDKEFTSMQDCKAYEKALLNLQRAFVILETHPRGADTFVCVMSTKRLAETWISTKYGGYIDFGRFKILPILIDEYNVIDEGSNEKTI